MVIRTIFIVLILLCGNAHADDEQVVARPVFGSHPGYLFNVEEEKNKRDLEMVMLPPVPPPLPVKSAPLVDEKLSREFQDQYRYRFGETQQEQVINNPGRDDEYQYYNSTSITVQVYAQYQQQFANYMLRRTLEYDVDRWFKNDPRLKPVYDVKDRFSNLDVKVKQGWKLKWKYNLAGPSMELNVENPYKIECRTQIMMTGLISTPQDIIETIGYQLAPRWHLSLVYKSAEFLEQVVVSRTITKHLSASVTASGGQIPGSYPPIYQSLLLFGVSWTE
jgi:hypothetical protein